VRVTGIDHVQLAMPPGAEATAVGFYEGLLGIPQVPKPAELATRGGCWFEDGDVRLHLGVEPDFRPAKKAHPALVVDGLAALVARLREHGLAVRDDDALPGFERAYVDDPFGNRIELLQPADAH
jgi:catechol 2,3-dioxygenase-like lactoylglutathione lyase family enzyme